MIDTLVIIGNGFDRWLGLNSGYGDFKKYYLANRDAILKKLHIKKIPVHDHDGNVFYISDVELIYGNPFSPNELDDAFWGSVETSMGEIDVEAINFFFGKSTSDLRDLGRSVANAKRILREAFCQWVASIDINVARMRYTFGDNCLFVNFNYTDTLIKAFQIDKRSEYHIHGEATDKKSIIFGHSIHPQEPEPMLYKMGGRFRGLYLLESLLRDTDKHTHENIINLCAFFASHGVMDYDIKDVYVLGHSMSPPDLDYISFFMSSTKMHNEECNDEEDDELAYPTEELHERLQYAINRYGYGIREDDLADAEKEAFSRQVAETYAAYDKAFERSFRKIFRIKKCKKDDDRNVSLRKKDAKWHISYHGEDSKMWYEQVMKAFCCTEYELHPTIEECIEKFKDE